MDLEITTDLWQVTDKHNVILLALIEIQLTTSMVIDTDCIDSCKSNNHTITTKTVPSYSFNDVENEITH